MNLTAVEIKAFVPASDFELSKQFYLALGFEIPWSSEDLAYVRHGETSFLLQAFNEPTFIKNFQMHMLVENVDDWHGQVLASGVLSASVLRSAVPKTNRGPCATSRSSALTALSRATRRRAAGSRAWQKTRRRT